MHPRHIARVILAGVCLIPYAYPQANTPLPPAEAILDRFVEASGGQARYDRVQNEVRLMTARMAGTDIAQIVTYRNRAGNLHQIAHGAGGQSELGVMDGIVWSRTGDNAHIVETGEERDQALQASFLLSDGQWRRVYKSAETTGIETVEGKSCYALKVVPFTGEPHKLWYDQKTGLQVREVAPFPSGGESETTAQEYFEIGGIKMPRVFRTRVSGVDLTMVVDDVKFNQEIPESIFALPSDIQRLMKKRYASQ